MHNKNEYAININNLKQALKHELVLKKVHRVIKFNHKAWLKSYFDMNTELQKNATNDLEKDFFKFMNKAVIGKTMEDMRKHRDIKIETTETRKSYLLSEPNYHTTKKFFFLSENVLAIEMKTTQIIKNKPFYLGLLIL